MPLLLLLLLLTTLASAQEPERVRWFEPGLGLPLRLVADGDGVVVLREDGTVTRHDDAGTRTLDLQLQGETLLGCSGAIYGVDPQGRLIRLDPPATGPRVGLAATPACLPGGRLAALSDDAATLYLLDAGLDTVATTEVDALPDAEPVVTRLRSPDSGEIALLAEPTLRYRHGILGDQVEAGAVVLVDADDLAPVARYRLPAPFVFEQRRVLPFERGLLATRSSGRAGAGVVLLTLQGEELRLVAEGPEIGLGNRWLNLFAAREGRAYSVRTPHIGGPLERYRQTAGGLEVERYPLGVTNHVIGARNLDLGVLLPSTTDEDRLALPSNDLRTLRLIECGDSGCRNDSDFELQGRLIANPAVADRGDRVYLYAADGRGGVSRFTLAPR